VVIGSGPLLIRLMQGHCGPSSEPGVNVAERLAFDEVTGGGSAWGQAPMGKDELRPAPSGLDPAGDAPTSACPTLQGVISAPS